MKYFGTDGFRGKAGDKLTVNHAYRVGRFLGWYFSNKTDDRARIVIGKDTRRSSYMFEDALSAGLTASGADVYLLHVTPTPSVSYVVRTEGFDCGIMISASHNPYYDNGIKLINGQGQKLEESLTELIEEYIDREKDDLPFAMGADIGRTVDYSIGRHRYIGYLISLAKRSFNNVTVALDCSNGSASTIAKGVFDALGAKTLVIHAEPSGTNINDNCGSTHIEGLREYVKQMGADIGFAFDGDADRCLCVDENGNLVDGDMIMYICGRYMKERGKLNSDTVVTTVMSNLGLYKAFDEIGIRYEKTAVGDRFVYENMVNNNYSLGGEQSGHIIFAKYAATGDGVLTALMVMEAMLEKKCKVSELIKDVHIYPQLLVNLSVEDKKAALTDEEVVKAAKQVEEELADNGRLLLRESGTEPLIRIMVEAESDELCKKYTDMIADVLKQKGHVV